LVTTDHAYPAVRNAMRTACERVGADLVEVALPLPLGPDDAIVTAIVSSLTARTRLAVIDHVTSSTAAMLPVARIASACRSARVPMMVDAAHAPGMLPVDVGALGVDFWTGNLHKWVCAPKGSAVLWVAPDHRERTHPLVVSHGAGLGFRAEFDWTGTHDPTPYLAAPAAIAFMGTLGWPRVMAHNHRLALHARDVVTAALGTPAPIPEDERVGSMALVELPRGVAGTFDEALGLQERLFSEHAIEVPITWWDGRAFVRASAQVYNAPAEYEHLASTLARTVGLVRSDT
jgi:isopenicillin-N epimerase